MTYQQIIDAADELYSNGYTPASKLKQIVVQEDKLLRTIYRKKTATAYDIVKDQFLYPLDFHPSKIMRVVWNGTSYDYEQINDDTATSPFLYTYERSIGIYPTPDTDVSGGIVVFHFVEPNDSPDLDDYPSFDNDFPMIQVYNLCKWMAERTREFDVANGFMAMLQNELDEFKRADIEPGEIIMRVE